MKKEEKKELLEYAYRTYFTKQHGDNNYFNFDITPLIKDFSFIDFFTTEAKTEHSAILVITDNQYILGYTDSYGIGNHKAAVARVMKDITGGGHISNINEAKKLERQCVKQFITARIIYDYRGDNEYGRAIYQGALYFSLPEDSKISIGQFENFKQFYTDYNRELEVLIGAYGIDKFSIHYEYLDELGTKVRKKTNSLQDVYTYYETCINENPEHKIENEVIFGISTKPKTK